MNGQTRRRQTRRSFTIVGCMLLGALVLVQSGCAGGPRISDEDLRTIEYERFVELRRAGEDELVVVVDVRQPEQYEAGHIPGAINLPSTELRRRDARLAAATRIIVYAGHGNSPLSPAAAKTLMANNYANVFDFRGGLQAWREAGRDVVQE